MLIFLVTLTNGKPGKIDEQSTSPKANFYKPQPNVMRRLNPLKLLFTVVHVPQQTPPYKLEWNVPLLKTMLLESSYVSDEDKELFVTDFSKQLHDYADWSDEKHYELERFTEKYFNIYKAPNKFLPFIDCPALTHALTDEMIGDRQPPMDPHRRADLRAKAVRVLCDSE
ncbi:unnamed protein product [Adineta steineri]|uniref:Uncharacterized protein n=1 Tax=Adineta steineri TaxID=433720 RepID=A0A813YS63_9BILA|nr:unnamed protein product [Adineta steineri]